MIIRAPLKKVPLRMFSVDNIAIPNLIAESLPMDRAGGFVFIDNLRFLAMFAMFVEHSIIAMDSIIPGDHVLLLAGAVSSMKGSVCFFLASGFLLGNSIKSIGAAAYLQRRFQRIFAPWLFWFASYVAALVFLNVAHGRTPITLANGLSVVGGWILFSLETPFWFVPNLMFSLCLLLVFVRFLDRLWFGGVLLCFSLFYAANVYLHWVPTRHTLALFGFVFYFWLGSFCSQHLPKLRRQLDKIPFWLLGVVVGAFWLASLAEYELIWRLYPKDDSGNALRITSQFFSLSAAALIFRFKFAVWPRFVNVRRDTFGLYLLQTGMLYAITVLIDRVTPLGWRPTLGSPFLQVMLWAVVSLMLYGTTLAVVHLIGHWAAFRWSIGLRRNEMRKPLVLRPVAVL